MIYVLYLLKLVIIAIYAYVICIILRFKKNEKNVIIKFDTLSMLELAVGAGLSLVSLGAVVTEETGMFTAGLCIIAILIAIYQSRRIILCGDNMALIQLRPVRIRDIKSVSNTMFSLLLTTKNKNYKIYVPLTGSNTLREKIVDKIR